MSEYLKTIDPSALAGSWKKRVLEEIIPEEDAVDELRPDSVLLVASPMAVFPDLDEGVVVVSAGDRFAQIPVGSRELIVAVSKHHRFSASEVQQWLDGAFSWDEVRDALEALVVLGFLKVLTPGSAASEFQSPS